MNSSAALLSPKLPSFKSLIRKSKKYGCKKNSVVTTTTTTTTTTTSITPFLDDELFEECMEMINGDRINELSKVFRNHQQTEGLLHALQIECVIKSRWSAMMHLVSMEAASYNKPVANWMSDIGGQIFLFEVVISLTDRCVEPAEKDNLFVTVLEHLFFGNEDAAYELYTELASGKNWWMNDHARTVPFILQNLKKYLGDVFDV